MGTLTLKGKLNLMGNLTLKDKVLIDGKEALVQLSAPSDLPHSASGIPVIIPPPPVPKPLDDGPNVWVIASFNQTVKAGNKPIVALGMAMQGNVPTWPGMMLPSVGNTGPVTINFIPVNVQNDQCIIFPSGASAALSTSGQEP